MFLRKTNRTKGLMTNGTALSSSFAHPDFRGRHVQKEPRVIPGSYILDAVCGGIGNGDSGRCFLGQPGQVVLYRLKLANGSAEGDTLLCELYGNL